jgi:hypothetical protein
VCFTFGMLPIEATVPPQLTVDLRYLDEESFKNTMEEQASFGWPDVTDQQKMFVHKYLIDFNHRKAAEAVGIDPDKAIFTLRDPLVNAYVKYLRRGLEAKELLAREMVAHEWLSILPKLKGEEEVACVTKEGIEVDAKKFHGPELIRALTELSKITGLAPDVIQSGGKNGVSITLNFGGLTPPPSVVIDG